MHLEEGFSFGDGYSSIIGYMENPTGPPSSDKVMQTILKEKKSSCNTESKHSCCPSATADGEQHSF